MEGLMFAQFRRRLLPILLVAAPLSLHAQNGPPPVKPGLWSMEMSISHAMVPPPDMEAKIAAMPPAQQAQVRSMMSAGKPTVTTKQECFAGHTSLDSMLDQAQQGPGMQCTFSNRSQTASSMSFDTMCTGQMTLQGHTDFHMADAEHISGTSHLTMTGSAQGKPITSTVNTTLTGKFVSADCGDVKPYTPPPAK